MRTPHELELRRAAKARQRARRRERLGLPPITRPSTIDRVELERRESSIYRPRVCRVAVGR